MALGKTASLSLICEGNCFVYLGFWTWNWFCLCALSPVKQWQTCWCLSNCRSDCLKSLHYVTSHSPNPEYWYLFKESLYEQLQKESKLSPNWSFVRIWERGRILVHFFPKCLYLTFFFVLAKIKRRLKGSVCSFQPALGNTVFSVLLKTLTEQAKKPWRSTCPRFTEKYSLMSIFTLIINKAFLLESQTNQVAFPIVLLHWASD